MNSIYSQDVRRGIKTVEPTPEEIEEATAKYKAANLEMRTEISGQFLAHYKQFIEAGLNSEHAMRVAQWVVSWVVSQTVPLY